MELDELGVKEKRRVLKNSCLIGGGTYDTSGHVAVNSEFCGICVVLGLRNCDSNCANQSIGLPGLNLRTRIVEGLELFSKNIDTFGRRIIS